MSINKLDQLILEANNTNAPHIIKNFVILNNSINDISLDHPFASDGIVFAICLGGQGRIKINFKEYNIQKNTVFTVFPKQIFERVDYSDDFLLLLLAFSPEFLSDIPISKEYDIHGKIIQNPVLNISPEEIQNLLRYHSFIIETFNGQRHTFFEQIIKTLLCSLLLEVAFLYQNQIVDRDKSSTRNEEIVEQFLSILKVYYKEGRTTAFYADKMFITAKHLSNTLKKVTGRPFSVWINEAVIIGAKLLLKSSSLTIFEISEELNFPNASYFCRFFKKSTGITPAKYREN